MDNTAMNICVHVLFVCELVLSILLSIYLGIELLHFTLYLIVS